MKRQSRSAQHSCEVMTSGGRGTILRVSSAIGHGVGLDLLAARLSATTRLHCDGNRRGRQTTQYRAGDRVGLGRRAGQVEQDVQGVRCYAMLMISRVSGAGVVNPYARRPRIPHEAAYVVRVGNQFECLFEPPFGDGRLLAKTARTALSICNSTG